MREGGLDMEPTRPPYLTTGGCAPCTTPGRGIRSAERRAFHVDAAPKRGIVAVLLSAVLLAGCGGSAAPAAPAGSPSAASAAAKPSGAAAAGSAAAKPSAGAAGGSAAAKPSGSAAAKPATKTKISIAQGLALGNASNPFAWIGQELGYFDEEGVDANIISLGGDNAKGDAMMASGQIDAAILGLEQILRGAAQGNQVNAKAVFNVQSKSQYEGGVLQDSPVKTMADLKGKTVAIPQLGATLETY